MNVVQEYRNPILIGVGGLVIVILLWFVWISPQSSHLSNLNSQKTQLQSKEQSLNAQLTTLRSEKQQLPAKCQQLAKISTQIPSVLTPPELASEKASFFQQLTNVATSANVVIPTFSFGSTTSSPATSTNPSGVVPVPVSMTVTGNYGQISNFIGQLDAFPRLFTVQTFSLAIEAQSGSGSTSPGAGSPSTSQPLWVGGTPTGAGYGPYKITIDGSIYYTTVSNPQAACNSALKQG